MKSVKKNCSRPLSKRCVKSCKYSISKNKEIKVCKTRCVKKFRFKRKSKSKRRSRRRY